MDGSAAYEVIGREKELVAAATFLDRVEVGHAVLHIDGAPGVGKTTVWNEILRIATGRGNSVLPCRPVSWEAHLAYVGLADLLSDVYDEFAGRLPRPQKKALDAVLLRAESREAGPDQRAVSTGFVTLLGVLAARSPVVVAVDDAHCLDRASAHVLDFAARRFGDMRIGLLSSSRSDAGLPDFVTNSPKDRVRRLQLGPLSLGALYHLIEARVGLRLTRRVLLKVEAASAGNPMFALEIARVLEQTGLPALGEPLPVPSTLSELVSTKIKRLPKATREAALMAAALSRPSTDLVDVSVLGPAVAAGVVVVGGAGVAFTHPVFAAAAYGEDAAIADALHDAAEHAAGRHAPEIAAELEEESARRTPSQLAALRSERLLRSAELDIQAGDGDRARTLAEEVLAAPNPPGIRARALHLMAETCYRDRLPEAKPLLEAALDCVSDDIAQVAQRELSLAFLTMATADVAGLQIHSERAVEAAEQLGDGAILAEALAMREFNSCIGGRGFNSEVLAYALSREDFERRVPLQLRPSMNAALLYEYTFQLDQARDLFEALRNRIVERGEESDLPFVLVHLGVCHFFTGEFEAAERQIEAAIDAAKLVDSELMRGFALAARSLARSRRGDLEAARTDALEALAICERVGWPNGIYAARWALGFVALSEGDHQAVVDALGSVVSAVEAVGIYEWEWAMGLPDALEALIATGELEHAARLIESLAESSRHLDRPWGLAESGRCRALLEAARGNLDAGVAAIDGALAAHDRLSLPFERARTLLVKGMLHRRARQKTAAREALGAALTMFEGIGAVQWAERSRAQLRRVGFRPPAPQHLTETERRVAELAATGLTNKQVAAKAFLSPKTVEDVLARIYRKLGIHSRAELGARIGARSRD